MNFEKVIEKSLDSSSYFIRNDIGLIISNPTMLGRDLTFSKLEDVIHEISPLQWK